MCGLNQIYQCCKKTNSVSRETFAPSFLFAHCTIRNFSLATLFPRFFAFYCEI